MAITQFTRFGYAYKNAASLTSTFTVHAVTVDSTNSPESSALPNNSFLESVELEISSIASSADDITLYLARDSAGDVPITGFHLAGATQKISTGLATATDGAVVFTVNKDYHFDSGVSATTSGTLFVVAKTDTGTCTANIRLNWRG